MKDKISIIVPIYNSEKYLDRCIYSIINQTYTNLEIILVNDGSRDSSLEICKKFAEIDNRILIINKDNGGAASARNKGLKASSGEYIGFIDSDDYIELDMYERLIKSIKKNNTLVSKCLLNPIKKINNDIILKNDEIWFILAIGEVSVCNSLFKSDLLKDVKFKENVSYEDTIFTIELLDKIESISIVNKKLYSYCTHRNTTTSTPLKSDDLIKIDIYNNLSKHIIKYNNEKVIKYVNQGMRVSLFDIIVKIANYGYDDTLDIESIDSVIGKLHKLYKYNKLEIFKYDGLSTNKKLQMFIFSINCNIYFIFKKNYNKLRKDI